MSPVKEANYFGLDGHTIGSGAPLASERQPFPVCNRAEYERLFDAAAGEKAVGEASPRYLASPDAAYRIRATIPDSRLVAILRDPVARAYSHWSAFAGQGEERRSFEVAIQDEDECRPDARVGIPYYFRMGLYARQLEGYLERFPREQLRIYLYDDLEHDPTGLLEDLFAFLDVERGFVPDMSTRYNVSGQPRRPLLFRLFGRTSFSVAVRRTLPRRIREPIHRRVENWRSRQMVRRPPAPETRARLCERYRSDLLALQDLIDRDLSAWLS